MSHTSYPYPQSTGGLTVAGNVPSLVREEEGGYQSFSSVLIDYIDLVNETLPKARAIVSLMEAEENNTPYGTLKQASTVVGDFIEDVLLAHKALQAEYYRSQRRERGK